MIGGAQPDRRSPSRAVLFLAGASGARSMLGPAMLAHAIGQSAGGPAPAQPARMLGRPRIRAVLAAAAMGELVADTLPMIPDRISTAPLVGRAMAGALVGASINALSGERRTSGALLGAVSAICAAHLTFHLRRVLAERLPDVAAAIVEDALVLGVARAGVAALRRQGL